MGLQGAIATILLVLALLVLVLALVTNYICLIHFM